jgi:hypothetical protein
MREIANSILSMPYIDVARLAEQQLQHFDALMNVQLNAAHNPAWMAHQALGAAQYRPPYVRMLSDEELERRFAKLTIDLKARRAA